MPIQDDPDKVERCGRAPATLLLAKAGGSSLLIWRYWHWVHQCWDTRFLSFWAPDGTTVLCIKGCARIHRTAADSAPVLLDVLPLPKSSAKRVPEEVHVHSGLSSPTLLVLVSFMAKWWAQAVQIGTAWPCTNPWTSEEELFCSFKQDWLWPLLVRARPSQQKHGMKTWGIDPKSPWSNQMEMGNCQYIAFLKNVCQIKVWELCLVFHQTRWKNSLAGSALNRGGRKCTGSILLQWEWSEKSQSHPALFILQDRYVKISDTYWKNLRNCHELLQYDPH